MNNHTYELATITPEIKALRAQVKSLLEEHKSAGTYERAAIKTMIRELRDEIFDLILTRSAIRYRRQLLKEQTRKQRLINHIIKTPPTREEVDEYMANHQGLLRQIHALYCRYDAIYKPEKNAFETWWEAETHLREAYIHDTLPELKAECRWIERNVKAA